LSRSAPEPSTDGGARPASASIIGAGERPGFAVGTAGTAYVAWSGPEDTNSTLHFCRLRRGATVCDAGIAAVPPTPATTTSVYRPFAIVSGDRVVVMQFRYPTSGSLPAGLYRFTSTNRGAAFTPPVVVGSVPFEEAATLSGRHFTTKVTLKAPQQHWDRVGS
jgi:hypothetical protein